MKQSDPTTDDAPDPEAPVERKSSAALLEVLSDVLIATGQDEATAESGAKDLLTRDRERPTRLRLVGVRGR